MEQITKAARTAVDLLLVAVGGLALGAFAVWITVRGPRALVGPLPAAFA
ncbi:hypothetical protein [Streptacidiphilus rugosus]|nr:hypothetical protein [Streptacidiphilus rugosus]